jgi:hypothetical protein
VVKVRVTGTLVLATIRSLDAMAKLTAVVCDTIIAPEAAPADATVS